MAEQLPLKQFVEGSSPPGVTKNSSRRRAVFYFAQCHCWDYDIRIRKPSLDIVPFLRIIKSTGEPIKAPIEESRLVEAVRDVQRKAESCTRPKAVEVPS